MTIGRVSSVVINCDDLDGQVAFWRQVLGVGVAHEVPGGFVWLEAQDGAGVSVALQRVHERPEGYRHLHLDLGVEDVADARARLEELGATHVEDHEVAGFRWTVMADREENLFCIAPRH